MGDLLMLWAAWPTHPLSGSNAAYVLGAAVGALAALPLGWLLGYRTCLERLGRRMAALERELGDIKANAVDEPHEQFPDGWRG